MEDFFESALKKTLFQNKIGNQFFNLPEKFSVVQLIAKQDLVLSGTDLFKICLEQIDQQLNYDEYFTVGQEVLQGQSVFQIDGSPVSMLKLQKTALELLEIFSGLATQTRKFVKACKGDLQVLDSCKFIPGYTHWYKQAMKHGGAVKYPSHLENHFIIDQKHIQIAGGLKKAIMAFQNRNNISIIVDVENNGEIKTACEFGASHIRFKNENKQKIKEGLSSIPKNVQTEIYGSLHLKDIPEIMELKVDFINLESLTHSFNPVGFEMIFNEG